MQRVSRSVEQETFISYRSYRWLKMTILALIACGVMYWANEPIGGRNGGTVIGYTYGAIATIGIVWLMAFGVRKRSYRSTLGTVEGWLAAHVWIGLGLLLLVPLHAGFSFAWNVHTLAYAFMVVTIVSGLWGMVNYATLAARIESHRGGKKPTQFIEQIYSLSAEIESLCKGKSDGFLTLVQRFDFHFVPSLLSILRRFVIPHVDLKVAGEASLRLPEHEREDALKALSLIDQKIDMATTVYDESRIKMLLRLWLFIHVPASIGLCVALSIHILSVFFFW